jgi:hypothetical protein
VARIFVDEALSIDPVELDGIDAGAREWAVARAARSSGTLDAYHGAAGPQPPRAWASLVGMARPAKSAVTATAPAILDLVFMVVSLWI